LTRLPVARSIPTQVSTQRTKIVETQRTVTARRAKQWTRR